MQLGIVITDEQLLKHAIGFIDNALARGWPVRCFLTDRGVLALNDAEFMLYINDGKLPTALCELSIERYDDKVSHETVEHEHIVVGGQYQDAELVKNCQRTIVL